jgi:hypothetical protein
LNCGPGDKKEISLTDRVTNKEVNEIKEEGNILYTQKRRKANWIGYILCRDSLLKHVIEGNIEERLEVTGRRERRLRRKYLLDDLKEGLEIERESTGTHSVENSLRKKLWTYSKTVCGTTSTGNFASGAFVNTPHRA